MATNNPNQNLTNEENKPKRKAAGFPGMSIPKGKRPRSTEEVAEARKQNAAQPRAKRGGAQTRKRPF
jgi:hypothetical protein